MKIKKTLSFTEAWDTLKEEFKTEITYTLANDPDYEHTDPGLSFKDMLLKLRNEYLTAETDEEQDAAIDTLQKKLTRLLNGVDWKVIIRMEHGRYLIMTGRSFVLDILFSVLEPDADIIFASVLSNIDDDI